MAKKKKYEEIDMPMEVEEEKLQTPWYDVLRRLKMGDLLEIEDMPFNIRRIPGGYMYEYEGGSAVFVSNHELRYP
jgi:hypothetical protein